MAAITIDMIESWYVRLRARVYQQFADAETWDLWVRMLSVQFDDLERATQSLFAVLDIDNSVGAQLDNIGRLIGQPRTVTDDATYRLFLKARIQANRSTGSAEDIYSVMRALLGETIGMVARTSPVKTIVLRVKGAITATLASYALDFFGNAKEAGARGLLEWQEAENADMFTFATGTVMTAASLLAATSITVQNTAILQQGIDQSLDLLIEHGAGSAEIVLSGDWSIGSSTQINTPASLNFAHGSGAFVQLAFGGAPFGTGLGFDDGSSVVGGELAGATQVL
jgi:hypothetical protein